MLLRTLVLVCHGYTNEEIARRTHYSLDTVRDRTKALFGIFDARNRAHLAGLNIIGLRRRGFTREQIHEIRRAYRLLFADEGTLSERVDDVAAEFDSHPFVHEILDFIREGKNRAICTPRDPVGSVG